MGGSEIVENREWKIVGTEVKRREIKFNDVPYPDVLVTLTLKRRSATHTAAVVVPGLGKLNAATCGYCVTTVLTEFLELNLSKYNSNLHRHFAVILAKTRSF
jgi:hypothetical protein